MTKSAMDLVQEAKSRITEISVEQAQKMLTAGSIAIDVRELNEYETGAITNAYHLSRGTLEFKIENHPNIQDKNASIIVYCKTGGRSALATASLQQLGFTNVHSLLGGYEAWIKQ